MPVPSPERDPLVTRSARGFARHGEHLSLFSSQKYELLVQQSLMLSQQHFATLPTELLVATSMLDDTNLGIEHLEPRTWSTDAFPLVALCQHALNGSEDRMKGVKSQQPADFTRSTAKRSKTELALSPCAISAYA